MARVVAGGPCGTLAFMNNHVIMTRISFLFIVAMLLTLTLMSGDGTIDMGWQIGISLGLMAIVGIPHGAIDHVLFLEDSDWSQLKFYMFYLGLIALYTVLWIFAPAVSMALFLVVSAYHFGQSQFSAFGSIPSLLKKALNTAWGISVIAALVYYNFDEIVSLAKTSPDVSALLSIFNASFYFNTLIVASTATVGLLIFCAMRNYIRTEQFFVEMYLLALIHICFYLTPLLIGFSLYFSILHSIKVLKEEFQFLNQRREILSVKAFIKLLLPFTILSLVGSGLVIFLSSTGIIQLSGILIVLILISVLTLPHSIVMNGFYHKMFGQGVA